MALNKKALHGAIALAGISAFALTACTGPSGGGSSSAPAAAGPIAYGTTDKVTSLDPAGSYDNGSFMVMNQVYSFLLNSKPGGAEPVPDLAESSSFTAPSEYTVKLKSGLKWANGHTLDSKDVKFSFDRQVAINDPAGPASLLTNIDSVSAPDATTVVFKLKNANDQTFSQILSSPAAPIVDDEVFPADKILSDDEIIKANAFYGQYTIDSYKKNELVSFKAFADYKGVLGKPANDAATIKYYASPTNLKLEIQQGAIDVAFRSLSATDIDDLRKDSKVKVLTGPGGEIRYITFNFDTMPFGTKATGADPAKALAVRQAVANLVDRQAIADQVYKGTYLPLYSNVPSGFLGANESFKDAYGDAGKPSLDKAKKVLTDAGITDKVALNLQYNPDHYGGSSGDEYAMIKEQLEKSGLFTVNLQSTEWVTYSKASRADEYPLFQFGWFPDFSDADNYLTPFFPDGGFLKNHYNNPTVNDLIAKQLTEADKTKREADIKDVQNALAKDISTLPLLQGAQVAVVGSGVNGVDKTLDPSFKFRLGTVSK
ncbi:MULTISPECIES: ABC transporter substrate-binding protein [Paenarthrobacter]|jgi:peptide/nickel transport system substrate-binding protein|uniref:Peptide/nickel transport system substrate-binding protein n=1 Tax=Paenarthrobacter nicotinovorans TaxID=29320 RepID=A0ABT9THH6_PAENI|nr:MULTISPECIES: ABC transporter substrate-binding protein [Paenarthrobacter]KIA72549.1 ABC-type dipeptide/oligopeptide transport system [Arthrobacter sp. MWB30]KQR07090.1 peptide ABC transporter substrate-binding protein [Arthrobacter sp. Leaf145]SKB32624.1 peptide/nickel transport system substrate-binding protein [Arthrobacter sp. 31Cvi3.1E]BCW41190.1 peptide ABC transporter substrate-binding protein [Arthrobacter sp. StoSoilB3]MDI2020462.1 Periplasmic dipeptide transport protein [Paenarthro